MRYAMTLVVLMLCACPNPTQCADCCPAGGTTTMTTIVACRVVREDGGAAASVRASCTGADAGGVTDSAGSFSFSDEGLTCGIAAGSSLCGGLAFTEADGGALSASFPLDVGAASTVSAERLPSTGCVLSVK